MNRRLSPEDVVEAAIASGSSTVAYTYSEPTVFFEYMLDCAKLARARGLRNVYHSNGFINPEPLDRALPVHGRRQHRSQGIHRGLLQDMANGSLAPVLRSLKILKGAGVHLEITTLLVPGRNDDPAVLRAMCRWIHDNLGASVPLHFSRFHPEYRLADVPPTPLETLELARRIAADEGLMYVYIGNVPGHAANSSYCPRCGGEVIHRIGYSVEPVGLANGACARCGTAIEGVWK